jgi:tetratricopeptide (TPR) repeat protein
VSRVGEFARLARQLEAERRNAAKIVPAIVANADRCLDEPLRVEWRTVGMVEVLCDAARTELVYSPQRSLHIAQLVAMIAEELPESYPHVLRAQMQAQAWKAVSNAQRFMSRYDASLLALEIADRRIANEPALAHDRATLSLARGLTLGDIGRTGEALVSLGSAREVFRNYRDLKRMTQCELVIGMTQYRLGKFADARQAFMRVIPIARTAGDLHTVAAAYNNLGRTAADAGDVSGAVDALQQARAIFHELDMPTEIARTNWNIGVAQLSASRFDSAIAMLSDARGELLTLGMPEEAGLAGVDLIEALLATEKRVAARELATAVVDEFRRAGLNERALQALSYLRETAT